MQKKGWVQGICNCPQTRLQNHEHAFSTKQTGLIMLGTINIQPLIWLSPNTFSVNGLNQEDFAVQSQEVW